MDASQASMLARSPEQTEPLRLVRPKLDHFSQSRSLIYLVTVVNISLWVVRPNHFIICFSSVSEAVHSTVL